MNYFYKVSTDWQFTQTDCLKIANRSRPINFKEFGVVVLPTINNIDKLFHFIPKLFSNCQNNM